MLDKFILNKFIYLFKIGCLTEKPFSTIKNIIIIIFADFFKLKIKYLATLNKSKFYYTYQPHAGTGLGGRGQFILREFYDKFFFIGHKILPKNFNFIDVGCSRGFFSLYLLGLKNFSCKGLCIDPQKNALIDFKEILKLNKKKNIKIINGVISNKSKKKLPVYKVSTRGYFSIYKDAHRTEPNIDFKNNFFESRSYTIDEIVIKRKLLANIKFIKIDAEGAEYEILKSSTRTIAKFKPIFYCEVIRKRNKIIKFFKEKNYVLFKFHKKKLVTYSRKNFEGDLLAVHKKDIKKMSLAMSTV